MKKNKKEIISLIFSKTLIFIFVVLLVSLFKSIFKPENSLIGVTTVVLMLVLFQTDLTLNPIKNLLNLIVLNLAFGLSAFLVSQNVLLGLILNFSIMLFIGYYFSYELKKPINMMVGLHYMLMIVSPISISQLPLRLLSLVAGAFMIMGVQLLANKNKLTKSRNAMFNTIVDDLLIKIDLLKSQNDTENIDKSLSLNIDSLKSLIFESGKSDSHFTECGVNTMNVLSCLEKINSILDTIKNKSYYSQILDDIFSVINDIKNGKFDINISDLDDKYNKINLYSLDIIDMEAVYDLIDVVKTLNVELKIYTNTINNQKNIQNELSIPQEFKELHVQKNLMKLKSPRFAYGLRLGLVVSLTFFIVKFFNIEYGEWAVYTVFALSQPHSEYTIRKSKKRIIGTIMGSIMMAILFNLVTDPSLRTVMLVLAGYLMSYVSDYRNLVAFITVSAVASAALYVPNPNFIIMNRILFVVIGIAIALIANKFVFNRKLLDEENNLNNIQRDSSRKMLGEVLLNEGSKNKSVIGILYLIPSLIDLRISYLNQNGLTMDKSFINKNKILMNDLYQIYLLEKDDQVFDKIVSNVEDILINSNNLDIMESRIQEAAKCTSNIKEKLLFIKISRILNVINDMNYSESNQSTLYNYLTAFN
ncbi:FUSC family protein [Paraclostridium bifermentans]|uniref:FUSC family protein n=1 Tax=Paraclostridium bifermentans TaxID=1490 RepID=UPI001F34B1B2|nr:FUSC family protein [Paraclostridium bifermentans]MCE9675979.1 FUSC family protein [Paraclostridium bifermentans]